MSRQASWLRHFTLARIASQQQQRRIGREVERDVLGRIAELVDGVGQHDIAGEHGQVGGDKELQQQLRVEDPGQVR